MDNIAAMLAEAQQTNRELEMIMDSVHDDILIASGEGIVLRASTSMLRKYGMQMEELVNQTVFDLERRKIFYPSVTVRVIRERARQSVIQENSLGQKFLATGIPIFDDAGNIHRIVTYSNDITELVALRELVAEMTSEIERVRAQLGALRGQDEQGHGLVAAAPSTHAYMRTALQVAKHDVPVLLLGESGVGKGVVARVIHNTSPRRDGLFTEINCGAIPESLAESELFGYEEGAFTGARTRGKVGLLELADGGTLFLDEIAELPLRIQVKLLRAIQDKQFYRVGGSKIVFSNFRLLTATNRNLEKMVKQGEFREDLYFRLNVVSITVQPLRERLDDLVSLAHQFLREMNDKHGMRKALSTEVFPYFLRYDWPGNVRELENLIERLVVLSEFEVIGVGDLPEGMLRRFSDIGSATPNTNTHTTAMSLTARLSFAEREMVAQARMHARTTAELAVLLGVSQPTAVRKLHKYFPDDPKLPK